MDGVFCIQHKDAERAENLSSRISSMRYLLRMTALIKTELKQKAESHLARMFPGIVTKVDGRYWKDESLWEANLLKEWEFPDDHAALWGTLVYLQSAASNWMITSGPHDTECEIVVSGILNQGDEPGLTWCSFDLFREGLINSLTPTTSV